MNKSDLRLTAEDSPERRIAVACRNLCEKLRERPLPYLPDIADFAEHLRPYIRREILLAELDEAKRPAITRGDRMRSIIAALCALDAEAGE